MTITDSSIKVSMPRYIKGTLWLGDLRKDYIKGGRHYSLSLNGYVAFTPHELWFGVKVTPWLTYKKRLINHDPPRPCDLVNNTEIDIMIIPFVVFKFKYYVHYWGRKEKLDDE